MLTELPTPKPLQPADDAVTYSRLFWLEFCKLVGREPGYCCSSAEWALIYEAWSEKVPVRIVLRGVLNALEGRKGAPPKSLLYFRKPIQEAYVYWRKAVG